MKATEAQNRIFEFVETGSGNGIINAMVGSGKDLPRRVSEVHERILRAKTIHIQLK